jgi:leader peptidase (prepilin peptidase) / N-methyltransferase
MTALTAIFVALLGAAIGSFAGVVASRGLHQSLGGRSHCDSCGRTLQWYELIPLISYPALGGRCRTCRARVRLAVYAWELGGAAVGIAIVVPILFALHPAAK